MSIQIFCMISANKKTSQQDPFVIPHISVLELGRSILKLAKNKKIVGSGWYKQPVTKIVITSRLT